MSAEESWTRRYSAAPLAVGVVSFFRIFHLTGYPYAPYGFWIVEYHLRGAGPLLVA
jgi:hypothetical protein